MEEELLEYIFWWGNRTLNCRFFALHLKPIQAMRYQMSLFLGRLTSGHLYAKGKENLVKEPRERLGAPKMRRRSGREWGLGMI